jgi:hypothetical protein
MSIYSLFQESSYSSGYFISFTKACLPADGFRIVRMYLDIRLIIVVINIIIMIFKY